ncbi:MAG: monosaccharide transporter substrate-binding protein family [Subtercola sp.]|nr:monosaccharide transporter substrate-binding protein family [Subtercola sp.]
MRTRTLKKIAVTAIALGAVVGLAACSTPETSASSTSSSTGSADTAGKIAFFGFSAANSFAQASFTGIQNYAKANNASATFLDGNFDSATQVQQIQDATTSGQYNVFIVQANDGTAVIPAVQAAIAKGITVVAEFTPVGTKYDTSESQVPGMYYVGDVITKNGAALGQMGLSACAGISPCTVAYLQGNAALPLDNARTTAVANALQAGGATVVSNFTGGYTADTGRTAAQDLLQADPNVNVIIGSSQAIAGVQSVLPAGSTIKLIGNGSSTQAITAVQNGTWFGTYDIPEGEAAALAAKVGLSVLRGGTEPTGIDTGDTLTDAHRIGTKDTLVGVVGDYSD